MITLMVSGEWLGAFLTKDVIYDPILINKGLPKGAKFVDASVRDGTVYLRYEAEGPDVEMEAELATVEVQSIPASTRDS